MATSDLDPDAQREKDGGTSEECPDANVESNGGVDVVGYRFVVVLAWEDHLSMLWARCRGLQSKRNGEGNGSEAHATVYILIQTTYVINTLRGPTAACASREEGEE